MESPRKFRGTSNNGGDWKLRKVLSLSLPTRPTRLFWFDRPSDESPLVPLWKGVFFSPEMMRRGTIAPCWRCAESWHVSRTYFCSSLWASSRGTHVRRRAITDWLIDWLIARASDTIPLALESREHMCLSAEGSIRGHGRVCLGAPYPSRGDWSDSDWLYSIFSGPYGWEDEPINPNQSLHVHTCTCMATSLLSLVAYYLQVATYQILPPWKM